MEKRVDDLASLLRPITLETFFANHWEKGLLFVPRADEAHYEGLLTQKNLEDMISSSDARYPTVMLAKDGAYFPRQMYCDDIKIGHVTFTGVPNLKRLSAEYGRGATVALTSPDRSWEPLAELCQRLQQQLDHGINTNAYLTAGQTTGFPPHYDTHDIFVLQVAGRKQWRIYEPTIRLPDVSQPCEPKSFTPGRQLTEVELKAGDLLYLPRGYGHAATTSKSHSAHVSIGVHVYTWAGVLKELDQGLANVAEWRKALPPGFASRAEFRPALLEQLKRMTAGRFTDGNLERVIDSIVRNVNQTRRRAPGRFRADATVLSVDSLLRTLPGQRYHLTRQADDNHKTGALTLDFDGNTYSFPPQLQPLLDTMCSLGSFRLKDLPGNLPSEALVDVASYLQTIGFLAAIG